MMTFDRQAYFTRIGFDGVATPDLESLQRIHLLHTSTIPFENLDVLLGRKINLGIDDIFNKLVVAGRGGYCFEQNGLLRAALEDIGFEVEDLGARVLMSLPPEMPSRTHRLLLVTINQQRFIADVGFGGKSLTAPVRLEADISQTTPHGVYRLTLVENDYLLSIQHKDEWQPLYRFDLSFQYPSDHEAGNHYVSTWPASHFRHHLMLCLKNVDGTMLTQIDWQFNEGEPRIIEQADELYQLLMDKFGLRVDDKRHGFSREEFAAACRF